MNEETRKHIQTIHLLIKEMGKDIQELKHHIRILEHESERRT